MTMFSEGNGMSVYIMAANNINHGADIALYKKALYTKNMALGLPGRSTLNPSQTGSATRGPVIL